MNYNFCFKAWAKEMIERGYGNGECNRFNENTKKYAEACVKVSNSKLLSEGAIKIGIYLYLCNYWEKSTQKITYRN